MSNKKVHIPWGSMFPVIVPWIAVGGFFYGLYLLYYQLWLVGGFLTIFTFLLMTLREGILIDPVQKQMKSYWGLLGLQFGTWRPIEQYKYLGILRTEGFYSDDMYDEVKGEKVIEYDLYLMSSNHLKRIMISSYELQNQALEAARDLSEDLGLEFVKYNPGQTVHQKRY